MQKEQQNAAEATKYVQAKQWVDEAQHDVDKKNRKKKKGPLHM